MAPTTVANLMQPHDTAVPSTTSQASGDLIAWIDRVACELRESFAALLDALELRSARPADLVRTLNVNRDIAGRVLAMSSAENLFQAIHVSPGPEPLRKVIRAAESRGADAPALARAADAVDAFERLIDYGAGTRDHLNAIVGSLVPDLREREELAGKYSIFRGQVRLRAVQVQAAIQSMIIHPSKDRADYLDAAMLEGALGVQRFRRGVAVHTSAHSLRTPARTFQPEEEPTIEDVSFDLDPFCVNTPARAVRRTEGRVAQVVLDDSPLGRLGITDSLAAHVVRHAGRRFVEPGEQTERAVHAFALTPSEVLLLDLVLHDDAYPHADPRIVVYNMGASGQAHIHDPKRDPDVLDVVERIDFLGRGPDAATTTDHPRYPDLLRHICDRLGWDPEAFRCFRCRIQYPVPNFQYTMIFEAPERPDRG